ncbi:chemotaxis response regulator protein-glutamate methylesterase [Bradyrhizobium sp. JYMT SZCCT0428]|uniref:protein-glutamate methylesterase/protein-glutamine glutaminase n=1 Tax=Bradyrhizobium sp. JYMT SZCCT0428 TaxID=2807673 RepID=UPI001BAC7E3B|nr:chemotaxis response regulator protein-glutamate methylesterase [Bradyrhizobium sp. JYMT SZCCT0428]MBR1157071.1 chemotaxis response regulator protein-glutamate methylesterase [Bradyrhizobium sp. JYMT SZCCT0428]
MSIALTTASAPTSTRQDKLRVMVVDDSVVIRGMISRWIGAEPDMEVVASLRTGLDAVNQLERINPDVAVLDIEMPELDGISALPKLLAKKRDLIIIMASTLTRRNAEISFKALSLGASDYIPKPESTREASAAETFRHDLIQKIRHLGAKIRRSSHAPAHASPTLAPVHHDKPREAAARPPLAAPAAQSQLARRPFSMLAPRVLLIGSSTGGPQALMSLVTEIGPVIDRFPVLITQHMPPTFTTILAEHLARSSRRPAHEAVDGETVKAGRIYLAPGGRHMKVVRHGAEAAIALDDGPPVNFCKPAVDPLFTSAIDVWQGGIMSVILTGMGSDGMRGGKDIVAAGGSVIAQDEATSVVWGMPGAAANAGICAAILPLNQIAPKLVRLFSGDRS